MTPAAKLLFGVPAAMALLAGACSTRSDSPADTAEQRAVDVGAQQGPVTPQPTSTEPRPTTSAESAPAGHDGPATRLPDGDADGHDAGENGGHPASVRVEDALGDPTGGQAPTTPEFVDLEAVTVAIDGTELRVTYELATPPPPSRGPAVLNLVTLVDPDCDGVADHELWGTLTDRGWETSAYQRTENGDMAVQDGNGMDVRASGSTVTLTAPVPDGAISFAWVAAAEDGLVADYRSGDTWRDAAPDSTTAHVGDCPTEPAP